MPEAQSAGLVRRAITARYAGRCPVCGGPYPRGETVVWRPGELAVCVSCAANEDAVDLLLATVHRPVEDDADPMARRPEGGGA
jgi:hypothetical protein